MSDHQDLQIEPDSSRPKGDLERFTRRRVGPAKVALAALLAVLITAASFLILSVALWAIASIFH